MPEYQRAQDEWDRIWMQFHRGLARNPGRLYRYHLIDELVVANNRHNRNSIIDVGCGTGELLSHLAVKFGAQNLLGLDISKTGLKIAQESFPNISFGLLEMNDLGLHSRAIQSPASIVVCSEVLEHLENPEVTLKFISDILECNGILIVTVPAGPMSFLEKYIGHHRHYTKESLAGLLMDSGFGKIEIQRAGYPGINIIRLVSLIRGRRILKDVAESEKSSVLLNFGLGIAAIILKYSLRDSRFGWQLIAVASKIPN